ncbi:MAG: long-chain fatty acid--CoA ligase [Syntrophomonadaceae bacterium]|nr:long-chain fatty acid--CoA ligase [Syntrophomonadaceae bacterium]
MGHYVNGRTMSEAFYATVEAFPERTAQLFNPDLYHGDNNGHFTWRETRERVELIALGLLTLGLDKKERVAIMSRNSPYWTHTDIAVINSGGVLVTIYPTLSLNEVTYIINDSESKYLFVGNENILEMVLSGIDKMPTLEKIIVLDLNYVSNDQRVLSLKDLIKLGEMNREKNLPVYEDRWKGNQLDDWATILYTSGTTGQGKGVILTHRSLSSRMDGVNSYFNDVGHPLNEEDRVLSFLPLSHIFDRGCSQWAAIWVGASIAYADSPATLMADLPKYNPTWFSCVPRLYEKIYMQFNAQLEASPLKKKLFDWALKVGEEAVAYRMDEKGRYNMTHEFDLKSKLPLGLRMKYIMADKLLAKVRALFGNRFRFAFSASAGIAPDLLKFFYIIGLPVMEGYGLTETTSACAYNPMNAAKPGTIGPTIYGSSIRLAEDGELEVSGAGLFVGYLNKPEENAASFTPDGWFKTGDIVKVDEDGYFSIVDRKKAIICLATGKNIAPAKIESLFATSLAIEQIFLIGDERTYITALVVPNYGYFIELFDREGIEYDKNKVIFGETNGAEICIEVGEDFINVPLLKQINHDEINAANSKLEDFESIKQYAILNKRFTEEREELTPTQKTKKHVIMKHYQDTIEELYQRKKA